MACGWEMFSSYICKTTIKWCGSLKTPTIVLAIIFGNLGLITVGNPDRHYVIPKGCGRILDLTFLANLALLFGITFRRIELLWSHVIANCIIIPAYFLVMIWTIFDRVDEEYIALAVVSSVLVPIHVAIVHGLLKEMTNGQTTNQTSSTPSNDGWIHQNLTIDSKDPLKEKSPELPSVFTTTTHKESSLIVA